ncbi:MAG: J domain-containing protein [Rhodocyclaceae bacterium]|nr:J domain-containing protein [Rhodocyclaceae bacterium]
MDFAPHITLAVADWLRQLDAPGAPAVCEIAPPESPGVLIAALAALAAEALARERTLLIVSADDGLLPELSNALDLRLRPLCLVLPGAEYAGRIALRATLSLLKSRLARDGEDSSGPAWASQRERLAHEEALWRASLAWSARGLDREAPPAGIGRLFPVIIGPWSVAERLAAPADWVILIQTERLPERLRAPWPGAARTLFIGPTAWRGASQLAPNWEALREAAELEVLGQELAEMELELATAQGELAAFGARYQKLVAWRIAELDRLEAELAKLRAERAPEDAALAAAAEAAHARAEASRREREAYERREEAASARFAPSVDLKKRFRQLAQKIHPDRAKDERERAWRTQLMTEANRAYREGDAAALEEVFALWREGQGAVPSAPSAGPRLTDSALARQAARMRARIAAIAAELDRLYGSKLYELFAAARVAARQGRDLLAEMAARLDGEIMAAQAELERLAAAQS